MSRAGREIRLCEQRVKVGEREFRLLLPESPDEVVRASELRTGAGDGYWAHLWSSALALAGWVMRTPLLGPGVRVLELGAGLGLPSIAAAARGAIATATDRSAEAVALTARNAERNGVALRTLRLDWSVEPPADVELDLIIGADILFDPRDHASIAALLARWRRPAWIIDPLRPAADHAASVLAHAGLRVRTESADGHRMLRIH